MVSILKCIPGVDGGDMTIIKTRLVFGLLVITSIIGCGGSSSKTGSNEAFSEIAAISVNCDPSDGGPASCNSTQNGKPVLLGWTSQSCGTINWSNLSVVEEASLT